MTMVRGEYAQLLAPGMHHIFLQHQDLLMRDEEYSHIFNVETSEMAYELEMEMAGVGPMPTKEESTGVTYEDAIQGGTVLYTHVPYALGMRASWELYKDDQYSVIESIPKVLRRSAQFTKEQAAFNIFNNGFSTVKTADGVSLFNPQHPLLGGPAATNTGIGLSGTIYAAGTFPNEPSTDVDLSVTALQLAINQFQRLVDGTGIPVVLKPQILLIPPELIWLAKEILGSPNKPYTADNEINSLVDQGLRVFISHYLSSHTAWYLLCDKASHRLMFFEREALDDDYADDFDTRSVKVMSYMRFSVGATTWYGTWGSNGP